MPLERQEVYCHEFPQEKIKFSVSRPVKELKGFKKVMLNAGESNEVEFVLTNAELGFYDNSGQFIVEAGEFDIMVGTNSQTGLAGKIIKK